MGSEKLATIRAVNVRLTEVDAEGRSTGRSFVLAQESEDDEVRRAERALARRLAARELGLILEELRRENLRMRVRAVVRESGARRRSVDELDLSGLRLGGPQHTYHADRSEVER